MSDVANHKSLLRADIKGMIMSTCSVQFFRSCRYGLGSRFEDEVVFACFRSSRPASEVIWCDGKKKAETDAYCSGHVHGEGWRSGGPPIDIGQGGVKRGREEVIVR